MENNRRWIPYDWFKLVVLLILLIVFIVLLLNQPIRTEAGAAPGPAAVATSLPAAEATVPAATSLPVVAATIPAVVTTALPTASSPATEAPTIVAPTQTPTVAPTEAPAAVLEPTAVPTTAPTATTAPQAAQPAPTAQASTGDCAKAIPARVVVGEKAKVLVNLYVRSQPGMDQPVLRTNAPGSQVDITGGPVCLSYSGGVYRWWNVKDVAGAGWSAEGSLTGKNYFLEPLP